MNPLLLLSRKSMWNRRGAVALTVLSIALSTAMLLGVERIRRQAREGFTRTVSGTDLIVGARTSSLHLLLASVFHLGDVTQNIDGHTVEELSERPGVVWTLPLALGDSHRGYRVVGTLPEFLTHYRYGDDQTLKLRAGAGWADDETVILGADVARELEYGLAEKLVVAHGGGEVALVEHDEHPVHVGGILEPTGTPIDRVILMHVFALERMHEPYDEHAHEADPLEEALEHRTSHVHSAACTHGVEEGMTVSAVLVGVENPAGLLGLQRWVNSYEEEALVGVLPGVALQDLWQVTGIVERLLRVLGLLVVGVGLTGMTVALLSGLNERRREIAILRALGAHPRLVILLMVGEAFWVTLSGVLLGLGTLSAGTLLARPWLAARLGMTLPVAAPTPMEWGLMAAIVLCGLLVSLVPASQGYRRALTDGLTVRV